MERINSMKKHSIIWCIIAMSILFTGCGGCGRRWWDNWDGSYAWVSEDPYIYMPLDKGKVIIEIDGEKWKVETAWEPAGTEIYFNEKWITHTEDGLIWVANVKLKKDKLYLTIVEDHYGNNEGKEIILEQQPVQE